MKLNLLRNNPEVLSGFVNLDPFAPGNDTRMVGDILDLDPVVENGEAETIIANDILDFLDGQTAERALLNWIRKLAYGGSLTLSGIDLLEVSKGVTNRSLSVSDANKLLHGDSTQGAYSSKRNNSSMALAEQALTKCGLKIMKKRYHGFYFFVEAERPKCPTP